MLRILIATFFLTLPFSVLAVNIEDYPALQDFIKTHQQKYLSPLDSLNKLFRQVDIKPDIIEVMDKPSEALPWHDYRDRFITKKAIKRALRFWRKHAVTLNKAETQYQVPTEIILAILSIESQFGRNKGSYSVINALTTLTLHYPRRSEFFRNELEEFLLLANQLDIDPLKLKGSYAGAIGLPQFMPSSYRRYAIDYNGDGRIDLINNADDAIGSVANYFMHHGWKATEPIADEAQIERPYNRWMDKIGYSFKIKYFANYGIFPENNDNTELLAELLEFEGNSGPIYMFVYDNFQVIKKYNNSRNYAMAVFILSNRIKQKYIRK